MIADDQDNVLNPSTVILNLFQNLISLRPGLFLNQYKELTAEIIEFFYNKLGYGFFEGVEVGLFFDFGPEPEVIRKVFDDRRIRRFAGFLKSCFFCADLRPKESPE
jgi:hypothetical protein